MSPMILCAAVLALNVTGAKVACEYMDFVVDAAEKGNIEPEVFISLIYHESGWGPKAVSRAGACGLTQVLPWYSPTGYNCKELKDPKRSIPEGAGILKSHLKKAKGNINVALCYYNMGPNKKYCRSYRVKKRGISYSRKILKTAKKIKLEYEDIFFCLKEEECCVDPPYYKNLLPKYK